MAQQPTKVLPRLLVAVVLTGGGAPAHGSTGGRSPAARPAAPAAPRTVRPVRVEPPIRMEPRSPLVVQYQRGQVYRREVRLIPRPGSGVKIRGASSDSLLVKAKLD